MAECLDQTLGIFEEITEILEALEHPGMDEQARFDRFNGSCRQNVKLVRELGAKQFRMIGFTHDVTNQVGFEDTLCERAQIQADDDSRQPTSCRVNDRQVIENGDGPSTRQELVTTSIPFSIWMQA